MRPGLVENTESSERASNPRAEIISLLRGGFSLPVIATLGTRGIIDAILREPYVPDITHRNNRVLNALLDYLASQGLLEKAVSPIHVIDTSHDIPTGPITYSATELGRKVLARWGSFAILNSYSDYFRHLDEMLDTGRLPAGVGVRRHENVIGSGKAHAKKFFPVGLDMVLRESVDVLVDLGCGDGHFAIAMCECQTPNLVLGVDLNPEVVAIFQQNVSPYTTTAGCVTDAGEVTKWIELIHGRVGQRIVISAWFVLHEFCDSNTAKAKTFFDTVSRICPTAELLIGEVVAHPPDRLTANRAITVMPEFQLFHNLSGQGLLRWAQFEELRAIIPYDIAGEHHFDAIRGSAGEVLPSNIIWYLKPKVKSGMRFP